MSKLFEKINTTQRKEVRLADVASRIGDGLHGTPHYDDHGSFYFINGNNLDNGYISFKHETRKVDESEYLKHKKELGERTLLLSINGTIGNLAKYRGEKCILGKSACYINVKNEFDLDYIYYILLDHKFQKHIESNAGGSTIKNVSLGQLRDYTFCIPNLTTQKKIAGILSAYDAKIENNNKIIKNLETTAQTIFNEWFVEFEFPHSPPVEGYPKGGVVTTSAFSHSSTGGEKRDTQNYYSLPYNPKLKERAKELRKAGNLAEVLLWLQIKNKQILGFDFDRQKIIGNYIVDFYCANIGLVVEIDGSSHNDKYEYDKERDNYLKSLGLTVVHFADADVKKNIDAVLLYLHQCIKFPSSGGVPAGWGGDLNLEIQPPRLSATPPMEGNKYKSSGGKMIESEMGEIPEGWEVGKIVDLTTVMNSGGTPSTINKDYYGGDISWFSTKELQDGFLFDSEKKITKGGLNNSAAKIFPEKTVVMAIYAAPTVGRLGILSKDSCFNQAAVGLVAKENVGYEFVYLLLKFLRIDLNNMANGAAQQNLNVGIVKNYNIRIPADALLKKFKIVVGPTFNLIFLTQKENVKLKESRDQLLVKLI